MGHGATLAPNHPFVIPAKAGIHFLFVFKEIPAFAGMTKWRAYAQIVMKSSYSARDEMAINGGFYNKKEQVMSRQQVAADVAEAVEETEADIDFKWVAKVNKPQVTEEALEKARTEAQEAINVRKDLRPFIKEQMIKSVKALIFDSASYDGTPAAYDEFLRVAEQRARAAWRHGGNSRAEMLALKDAYHKGVEAVAAHLGQTIQQHGF